MIDVDCGATLHCKCEELAYSLALAHALEAVNLLPVPSASDRKVRFGVNMGLGQARGALEKLIADRENPDER